MICTEYIAEYTPDISLQYISSNNNNNNCNNENKNILYWRNAIIRTAGVSPRIPEPSSGSTMDPPFESDAEQ